MQLWMHLHFQLVCVTCVELIVGLSLDAIVNAPSPPTRLRYLRWVNSRTLPWYNCEHTFVPDLFALLALSWQLDSPLMRLWTHPHSRLVCVTCVELTIGLSLDAIVNAPSSPTHFRYLRWVDNWTFPWCNCERTFIPDSFALLALSWQLDSPWMFWRQWAHLETNSFPADKRDEFRRFGGANKRAFSFRV